MKQNRKFKTLLHNEIIIASFGMTITKKNHIEDLPKNNHVGHSNIKNVTKCPLDKEINLPKNTQQIRF